MTAPEIPRLPTRLYVLLATIGLVLGGLALSAGALAYTSEPSFCASCHAMETRYVSWQRSQHAEVASCIECHSEPGFVGEIKAHLDGTRYLFVMLTGATSGAVVRGEVPRESCLECHRAETLPDHPGMHRVEHATHLTSSQEVGCADCHGSLVHGSLRGAAVRPAMNVCIDCHQRTAPQALNYCALCHGPGPVPPGGGRVAALREGAK